MTVQMRFMPDRDETIALVAVWLTWPALHLTGYAVFVLLGHVSICLPLPARLAFAVLLANRICLPSLVGTAAIALTARFAPTPAAKRLICHLITLLAFAFTVSSMLALLTVVWAMV